MFCCCFFLFFSFFIQREISAVSQPIAVKLCHMIGNGCNFKKLGENFGGPPHPKKFGAEKHAFCTFGRLRSSIANISRMEQEQLRRKNRLMRSGRVEEAGALAKRVQASIIRHNTAELRRVDTRHCAKDAWAKVRKLTKARDKSYFQEETNLTAQILNDHYAAVSTDQCYQPPQAKLSASQSPTHVTELQVFRMLDKLRPTATGLDSLPAWFLRLGAPVFCAPLAQLFNQSINSGVVPRQWKKAIITPIPKIQHPTQPNEYRPISITSALSRSLERRIVRAYIYPAILQPPVHLYFADQFAFRPTGSTVAALITLIHTVTTMLSDGPYVHVFSLDFSKAFDTVRHATLMEKLSTLAVPDEVYNWIKDFLRRSLALHQIRLRRVTIRRHHGQCHTGLVSRTCRVCCYCFRPSSNPHRQRHR